MSLAHLMMFILGLTTMSSAANTPLPHLIQENSSSPSHLRNFSAIDGPVNLNISPSPPNIDPRFTYERRFADQILDKKSAYLSTLLVLKDLSTKGWTSRMMWETQYSFSQYRDVTIRIHPSGHTSSMQYRYAIWGLYNAIREASANGFRFCVLTLYWSPILGGTRHILGYVSILGSSSLNIDISETTGDAFEFALPTQALAPGPKSISITTNTGNSTSLATETTGTSDIRISVTFQDRQIDIDAMFQVICTGIVYLASWPQSRAIIDPGVIRDHVSRTILRWDASHLQVQPGFEYKYAIAALTSLPIYMYEQNRFEEARCIVYVNGLEVGRGWLYRTGVGEASDANLSRTF